MGQLCSGPKKFEPGNAEKVSTVYSPASQKRDSNCSDATGIADEVNGEFCDEQSFDSANSKLLHCTAVSCVVIMCRRS